MEEVAVDTPTTSADLSTMQSKAPSVGLGGDGDEIAALQEVEEAFGVQLDYTDAHDWSTVGDVYAALLRELPDEAANQPDVWDRFARALCRETGIEPARISLESGLVVEDGMWVQVENLPRVIWLALIVAGLAGIGWLLRSI